MKKGQRIVMMFGFEKKNLSNIDDNELKGVQEAREGLLGRFRAGNGFARQGRRIGGDQGGASEGVNGNKVMRKTN